MKSKCIKARAIVLTLELVILIALAGYSSTSYLGEDNFPVKASINKSTLILTKEAYSYGEEVLVYIANPEKLKEISIIGERELYMFVGTIKSPLRFNPQKPGNYTITAILDNGSKLENSFYVAPALKTDKEDIASVSTDKKEYMLGETVIINLNFTKNESYSFSISSKDRAYNYIDIPEGRVRFIPKEEGRYYAQLLRGNETIGSCFFDVKKKEEKIEIIENIATDKKDYILGEQVNIYLTGNITEFKIIIGQESFNFIDVVKNTSFVPKKPGEYEIRSLIKEGNETKIISYYFFVSEVKEIKERYDYIFNLTEDAVIDFDFSGEVEKRKTLLDRILKTQLIDQVTFYVKDHSQDPDFSLRLERLDNNKFRVYVFNNKNIEPGIYNLVAEAYIKGELVSQEKTFKWFSEEKEIEDIIKEKGVNITEIKEYIPYYFDINEEPVLEIDFSSKVKKERNILDIALKKPAAEKISAYIYGEENNTDFVIHIEHLEYDKFRLSVDKNKNIKPDVYKLIAIIKAGEEFLAEQKLFSWGISNVSVLLERIKLKDKEISLDEIIRTTGINLTEEKAEDKPQSNESISNITEEIQENKTITNLTKDASSLIVNEINKSVKLINLSNKLISETLDIRSSKGMSISASAVVHREEEIILERERERNILGIFSVKESYEARAKKYDIDIFPEDIPVEKISFKGLAVEDGKTAELRIEALEKEYVKIDSPQIKNSFAVDPSSLIFNESTISMVAKGTELYKCAEWNFQEKICEGTWEKVMDIVPGKEYEIEITPDDPAFAETGVASINTKKSIYRPGETAEIIIVVLDNEGYLVGNADVELEITSPNNEKTYFSTAHKEQEFKIIMAEKGIYKANYIKTEKEGNYLIEVRASGKNVDSSMQSYFSVKEYYEFDILRDTPVTTDPWKGPFSSSVKIISFTNDSVFDFSEVLPASFSVVNPGGADLREQNGNKILKWRGIENGTTVSYSAIPPLITPELYEIGPSFIEYSNEVFTEARPWYLAVDPVTSYYDPNSDIQTELSSDCANHYECVDDGVRQPSTPVTGSDRISGRSNQNDGDIDEWGFPSITQSEVNHITAWIYASTGARNQFSISLKQGNNIRGSVSVPVSQSAGWYSINWTSVSGDLSDMRIEVTHTGATGQPTTGYIYAAYLEVNAEEELPEVELISPSSNSWINSRSINFTFNASSANDIANCSLWTNESGWSLKRTNTTVISNGGVSWINETFSSDGSYLWNIECYDDLGSSGFASANFTVNSDTTDPDVQPDIPEDNYFNDQSDPANVLFRCNITDNMMAKNISLYITNNQNESFAFSDSCDVNSKEGYCEWQKSLANGNYTWGCLGYDMAGFYDWGENRSLKVNSSITVPKIDTIQCEKQGSGWVNCSNIGFQDTLTAVRANFTQAMEYIINASFNLTNIPDSYTYFHSNATYNSSGWWVFNNTDITINDSGDFKLSVFSWDSSGATDSKVEEWNVPWGYLSATLVYPASDIDVSLNEYFTFTANVECIGGECGDVNATLDPTEDTYYDPNSDIQTDLQSQCANHYECVDDGIRQPSAPVTGSDRIYATSNNENGNSDEWGFSEITQREVNNITAWVYASTGQRNEFTVMLKQGDTTIASADIGTSQGPAWYNVIWSSVSGDLSDMRIEVLHTGSSGAPTTGYIYAAYLEVNHNTTPTKDGAVSTVVGDRPFYTNSSNPKDYNDVSCLQDMSAGESCDVSWYVNATGWINTTHEFFVIFNMTSNYNYVDDAETPRVNITIKDFESMPPSVTLVSPSPDYITNNNTLRFNCSATDATGLTSIVLYADFNGTFVENGTESVSGTSAWAEFTRELDDGIFNWNCRAYDIDGNDAWANENRTLTVDTKKPYIELHAPEIDDTFYVGTIEFNFTATDNIDSSLTCNLTINSVVRAENFPAQNSSVTSKTISGLSQDSYLWNVTCWDDAGNINTSETRNFTIIDLPPSVELTTADNIAQQSTTIDLEYLPSDNNNVTFARLILNGNINDTTDNVTDDVTNTFTLEGLSEGKYNWTVNVSDISNLSAQATERYFTIDFTPPQIMLIEPEDPFSTSSSSITFRFNVTDNLDEIMQCNITINGTAMGGTDFFAQNNSITSKSINNIPDGISYWNVTCRDDAKNSITSETRMINVSEPPTVVLNSPINGHSQNWDDITLYYTPTDNSELARCDLVIDGQFNQTNSTPITNGAQNSFTLSGLAEGSYLWTVNCTDVIGLGATASPARRFYIDTTKPIIELHAPEHNDTIFSNTILFNYTAIDNIDQSLFCNITVNNTNMLTDIVSENNSYVTQEITMPGDGVYYWNVSCWDDAGNINTSETRNFTSFSPPEITLISPEPDYITNNQNITFEYVPYDSDGIANSSLIINGNVNQTNSTPVINNESNYFNVSFGKDGIYTWTVRAYDIIGLEGEADPRTIIIDTTHPEIIMHHPYEGQEVDWNNVTFNFTVTDNLAEEITCDVTIDGTDYTGFILNNGSVFEWNEIMLDGSYNWSAKCTDEAGNYYETPPINFTVYAPPEVVLISPIENNRTKNRNITFEYIPYDGYGFENCTLIINGQENETDYFPDKNQLNYFELENMDDGLYNWTVMCIDYEPDANEDIAPPENFTIDNAGPIITLNKPEPEQVFNYNDIHFNWTATDADGITITCNLSVSDPNGERNENNIAKTSGSYFNITVNDLDYGLHHWNVSCADDLGNSNISEIRNFTVNQPDLKISSSDIVFNDTSPVEGHNITINATIYNIGGIAANNFIVLFYDGEPSTGDLIDNQTISTLDYGENITINTTWITTLGLHEIWVVVDPDDLIAELNETNNNASSNITISSWHIIYGQSLGNLVIYDLQNTSVFEWYVNISGSGNIFAVDYDSSIKWDNLTAIGIDIDGNQQIDDFEEIDSALESTNFTDSVNSSFTVNGAPRNKTSFVVFSRTITNVSVVNSTNNSNFITGILWDSSDGGAEYNGSQDLIFISKINSNKQGYYGVYDYEIRVPSELKKYIAADQYSVALYAELR